MDKVMSLLISLAVTSFTTTAAQHVTSPITSHGTDIANLSNENKREIYDVTNKDIVTSINDNSGAVTIGSSDVLQKVDIQTAIDDLYQPEENQTWLEIQSLSRFQISTPTNENGVKTTWRYDNSDNNFDDPPGFSRPYILTLVNNANYGRSINHDFGKYTLKGTWIDTGFYRYSDVANDKISLTTDASSVRMTLLRSSNAGIVNILIDGKPANLVDQIDLYSATTESVDILVADDLGPGEHTIEMVVTGTKNEASTGFKGYIFEPWGIRTFNNFFDDTKVPANNAGVTTIVNAQYWSALSATTYAMAFRPASMPQASTGFIGSVHGYENRDSFQITVDGENVIYNVGSMFKGKVIEVKQTTTLKHPDKVGDFASVTLVESYSREGYSQSYAIRWLQDVFFANGYTQMWISDGGLTGGIPGNVNGWNDRVLFNTGNDVPVITGGSIAAAGRSRSNEVLFYGTTRDESKFPLRIPEAGNMAMFVSVPNYYESMLGFQYGESGTDLVWIQDRNTYNKMYFQPLRNAGLITSGTIFRGLMKVKPIFTRSNLVSETFRP